MDDISYREGGAQETGGNRPPISHSAESLSALLTEIADGPVSVTEHYLHSIGLGKSNDYELRGIFPQPRLPRRRGAGAYCRTAGAETKRRAELVDFTPARFQSSPHWHQQGNRRTQHRTK